MFGGCPAAGVDLRDYVDTTHDPQWAGTDGGCPLGSSGHLFLATWVCVVAEVLALASGQPENSQGWKCGKIWGGAVRRRHTDPKWIEQTQPFSHMSAFTLRWIPMGGLPKTAQVVVLWIGWAETHRCVSTSQRDRNTLNQISGSAYFWVFTSLGSRCLSWKSKEKETLMNVFILFLLPGWDVWFRLTQILLVEPTLNHIATEPKCTLVVAVKWF